MQTMRDLLRRELGRSLGALAPLDRLAAAWPVACGPALAGRGEVLSFENGTLRIGVAAREWLEMFRQMHAVLQSDLSRIAGVPVSTIHFEWTPRSPAATAASAGTGPQETYDRDRRTTGDA